ncbi:MAG: hypothetical protein AABY61_00320 [Nitrospirota bacterium]
MATVSAGMVAESCAPHRIIRLWADASRPCSKLGITHKPERAVRVALRATE